MAVASYCRYYESVESFVCVLFEEGSGGLHRLGWGTRSGSSMSKGYTEMTSKPQDQLGSPMNKRLFE